MPPPTGRLINVASASTMHQFSALFISGLKLLNKRLLDLQFKSACRNEHVTVSPLLVAY